MNYEDFRQRLKADIEREIGKYTGSIEPHWTIGDGNEYKTKLHANIAAEIRTKGFLYVDTVLESTETAKALDELVQEGILIPVDSEDSDKLKFRIR